VSSSLRLLEGADSFSGLWTLVRHSCFVIRHFLSFPCRIRTPVKSVSSETGLTGPKLALGQVRPFDEEIAGKMV
jgi:hypothetical protein